MLAAESPSKGPAPVKGKIWRQARVQQLQYKLQPIRQLFPWLVGFSILHFDRRGSWFGFVKADSTPYSARTRCDLKYSVFSCAMHVIHTIYCAWLALLSRCPFSISGQWEVASCRVKPAWSFCLTFVSSQLAFFAAGMICHQYVIEQTVRNTALLPAQQRN